MPSALVTCLGVCGGGSDVPGCGDSPALALPGPAEPGIPGWEKGKEKGRGKKGGRRREGERKGEGEGKGKKKGKERGRRREGEREREGEGKDPERLHYPRSPLDGVCQPRLLPPLEAFSCLQSSPTVAPASNKTLSYNWFKLYIFLQG